MMTKFEEEKLILIHGLEGSSQGDKATLLRSKFPRMLTPDFRGTIEDRMIHLYDLLGKETGWTIIGSSLGGLMAALFCAEYPQQVQKLVLLAPALFLPEFSARKFQAVDVPTVIIHGVRDTIVPLAETRALAEKVFKNLVFSQVEDDHRLFGTMQKIDWEKLVHDSESESWRFF